MLVPMLLAENSEVDQRAYSFLLLYLDTSNWSLNASRPKYFGFHAFFFFLIHPKVVPPNLPKSVVDLHGCKGQSIHVNESK